MVNSAPILFQYQMDKQQRKGFIICPKFMPHNYIPAEIICAIWKTSQLFYQINENVLTCGPRLKPALRPPPSAWAENANFRPFYVKRADFSPPPPATKKRRKLVKIRPRCPHLATKKRRKVVKIRPCGGWWVGGCPPPFLLKSNTVK